jgi:hypothetical protein
MAHPELVRSFEAGKARSRRVDPEQWRRRSRVRRLRERLAALIAPQL